MRPGSARFTFATALALALTGCSITQGGRIDKDDAPGFIGKTTVESIRQQQWTEAEILRHLGPPAEASNAPHSLLYVKCVFVESREVPLVLPIPGIGPKTLDNWCEWVGIWFNPAGRASTVERSVEGCGGCRVDASREKQRRWLEKKAPR